MARAGPFLALVAAYSARRHEDGRPTSWSAMRSQISFFSASVNRLGRRTAAPAPDDHSLLGEGGAPTAWIQTWHRQWLGSLVGWRGRRRLVSC